MDTRLKDIIAQKGLNRSQIEVLDALLKLRQVCNHPKLLSLKGANKVNQSAKLEHLMETLPEQIDEGRKIIIFSQPSFFNEISFFLMLGFPYLIA